MITSSGGYSHVLLLLTGLAVLGVPASADPSPPPDYIPIHWDHANDAKFEVDTSSFLAEIPTLTHHSGPGDWNVGDVALWFVLGDFGFFFAPHELTAIGTFAEIWFRQT